MFTLQGKTASALDLTSPLNKTNSIKQILGPTLAEREAARKAAKLAEIARKAEEARLAEEKRMQAVWSAHPAGNDYVAGQCTWYVASKRPVPMTLGNAGMWFVNAQAWGFPVGSEPRAGAVAVSTAGYYGHVAYVESVQGDMVLISEMNWLGPYVVNTRVTSKYEWQYIY